MSAGRRCVAVLVVGLSATVGPVAASAASARQPPSSTDGGSYASALHAREGLAVGDADAGGDGLPATATPLPGFPSASNTGVPAGMHLRPSGALVLSTPGEIVDGLDIAGKVVITANDVTIRRSRIRNRAYSVVEVAEDVTGTILEDVELDGTGQAVDNNGIYGEATVRRADIHGVAYGAVLDSGSVLEDSYIHGLLGPGSAAFAGVVVDGDRTNVTVRHNTIIATAAQTAAVLLSNYFGPLESIHIEGNHLSGGAFTVEVEGGFTGGVIDDVRIAGNRLGAHRLGYAAIHAAALADASGNVDAVTGQSVEFTP